MAIETMADFWRATGLAEPYYEEARAEVLLEVLRDRFGEHDELTALAERLGLLSASDAMRAIRAAADLAALLVAEPRG